MSPSGVLAAGLPRRRAIIGPAYARERTSLYPAAARSSGGASAWQIATASASAAWCGVGSSGSERIIFTIRCICAFSARPYPQIACLTLAGAYSRQSTPALAAATSTAPRTCPTESAMRASAPTYDSSIATASGACSAMSTATASWIVFKRRTESCPAGVDQQPCATSLRRPPLSWTTPYPQAAVPGSMPTTFTSESYGPDRTIPVQALTGCPTTIQRSLGREDAGPGEGLVLSKRCLVA